METCSECGRIVPPEDEAIGGRWWSGICSECYDSINDEWIDDCFDDCFDDDEWIDDGTTPFAE